MAGDVRRVADTRGPSRAFGATAPVEMPTSPRLVTSVGRLELPSPILSASGCFASGPEIDRFWDVSDLGAVVVKSVTLEPRDGLPTPRMAETPSGMLNAIGLQNPGVRAWLEHDLPWLVERRARVVVSIAGGDVDEFRQIARILRRQPGIAAIEINLSCPNVEHRGLVFACSPEASAEVVTAVVRDSDVPVFAKLTSDVTDVVEVARAVARAGASGVTLVNTLLGMAIDPQTGRPSLYNGYGGLSGPAIRPVAVRNVHQVHCALPDLPIIGCGGVQSVTDVVQMLRAGASAVQVGTATFVDPFVAPRLARELDTWLSHRGLDSVGDLVGAVTPWRDDA
ncbi:MAG: dihydroorotate dehydrogenase [Nitriliruptoraceae bacterium]